MKKILIAGGTGLIGQLLSIRLEDSGYEVSHLSRRLSSSSRFPTYLWNSSTGYIDPDALKGVNYVINLAGAAVADRRWSNDRKKLLIDSRVQSTATIARYIVEGELNLDAYISASAIGYYGNRGDELLTELSSRGEGFLADCTVAWENAIEKLAKFNVRMVGLRIGIVLSNKGGALEKILMPFKMGVANWFGNGQQYYSWIHIEDVCNMFIHALENNEMAGFYNAVAPEPVTNKTMINKIAKVKGKSYLKMPVPQPVMRLAMGEMADIVLDSTKVSAAKIQKTAYQFKYPRLEEALKDLL